MLTRKEKHDLMLTTITEGPECGLSIREIQAITIKQGHSFSLLDINDYLCDVRPQLICDKILRKNSKVSLFRIKESKQP